MRYDYTVIGSITGQIKYCDDSKIVIDTNGVGYKVFITPKTALSLKTKDSATLWTHLSVKETALDLYGFLLQEELSWFERLITITGIGPKSALSILSATDSETLLRSVQANDPEYLHKTSGIGIKTSSKIISGLKEKMREEDFSSESTQTKDTSLVFDALVSLGYSPSQSRTAISNTDNNLSVQDQIKEALKKLR